MVLEPTTSEEYTHWRWRPHSSFVLNETATSSSMIHATRCLHLRDPDESLDHVAARKRCADSITELLAWAEQNDHSVIECTTCTPFDRQT